MVALKVSRKQSLAYIILSLNLIAMSQGDRLANIRYTYKE
jgi:hypothetical protein